MADRRHFRSHNDSDPGEEFPPFSRLFIICNKFHTEAEFREQFSKYGTIEDIWVVKDRNSGENKGVTYVKFSKTSEAALALEDMNGKTLGNVTRPIRVMVASSKHQGQARDNTDYEKYVRLFVMTPKTMNDSELIEEFNKFGKVESAIVIKDKDKRESKGYGYVKYKSFSEAANAFENADKKFKAIFAEPKKYKSGYENSNLDSFQRVQSGFSTSGTTNHHSSALSEGYTRLQVTCSPVCQQGQIRKLFDLIPGLEFCQLKVDNRLKIGVAQVLYDNHQSAKYAFDKLHGFEYPPGAKIFVKPEYENLRHFDTSSADISTITANIKAALVPGVQKSDLAQLAETIAQASTIIQAAAAGSLGTARVNSNDDSFCSVRLPSTKPLASIDAPVAQRCFIVCQPHPPPILMLRDAFSRFGDLIDVYTLPAKNVGYVKYASVQSAQDARKTLHGAEICGIRLKVLEAEEPRNAPNYMASGVSGHSPTNPSQEHYDDRRKRLKMDSS